MHCTEIFRGVLKQEPLPGGATLDFLLFLKANKEMFEQILMYPFYKFNRSVLSN
jgi:hypothetical protein